MTGATYCLLPSFLEVGRRQPEAT